MKIPMCDYGCGQPAKYFFKNGKKCCSKHIFGCPNRKFSSPAWNKGLTKETDKRVKQYSENMKKTKSEGNYTAWNKGLTKETDERVKQYSKNVKISKIGVPNYKNRKPLNECITATELRFHIKRNLYTDWVFPILKRDNFKCQKCGNKNNLEVHHIKSFKEIFSEALDICRLDTNKYSDWSSNDISYLEKTVIELHNIELGITLCKKCHGDVDEQRKQFFKNKR